MNLNSETMVQLLDNPSNIQKMILEELEEAEGITISNASNPFTMLLEAASTLSHAVAIECKNNIRKTFPNLAVTMEDLYHHLDDKDINGIAAIPGTAEFRLRVNLIDIKNNGYRPSGANYLEVRIPSGTTITALTDTYTILNPIVIRSYDVTEAIHVEMLTSNTTLANNSISVLQSSLVHDTNDQVYIQFIVPVKQVTMRTYSDAIIASSVPKKTYSLTDSFVAVDVGYLGLGDASITPLAKTLSDEYLNPNDPKALISFGNKVINVTIPTLYVMTGVLDGTLYTTVYETKGRDFLPLDKYKEEQFTLTYGKPTTQSEQNVTKIKVAVDGASILSGGAMGKSFEEIKSAVVFKKFGPITTPITQYEIEQRGTDKGFKIIQVEDTVSARRYVATRDMVGFSSAVIKCLPDFFNNTVGLKLDVLKTLYPEWVRDDDFIIKSGTIFKENNGVFEILGKEETEYLENMTRANKIKHLAENKYFYNHFTYSVKTEEGTTDCRIFHIDNPIINGLRHLNKNSNVLNIVINVSKYAIQKTPTGYKIIIKLDGNNKWKEIEEFHRKVQISFSVSAGFKIYYEGVYDANTDMYSFDIATSDFIRNNGQLQVMDGLGDDGLRFIDMTSDVFINIYTTDPNHFDVTKYLRDLVYNKDPNVTVITYDRLNITFGKEIKYLWNKVYHTYTERQYKTYKEDKLKYYEANVYKTDSEGNIEFKVDTTGNNVEMVILHKKGEPVVDEKGNQVYEYKKGDLILQNGKPVVDAFPGVIRYLDMIMVEYAFRAASASTQDVLNRIVLSFLEGMLFKDLPELNAGLLERTEILYRSDKNCNSVIVKANNKVYTLPYAVKPKITIYVDKNTDISLADIENYKYKIGTLISSEFKNKVINTIEISEKIKKAVGSGVISVQLYNLIPEDAQVATIESDTTFVINKVLYLAEYKETLVVYDIDINVEKI